jgi:hypothetical protein
MAKLSRRAIIKALGASMLTAAGLVLKVAKADEPTAALGRHSAGPNDPPPITISFLKLTKPPSSKLPCLG